MTRDMTIELLIYLIQRVPVQVVDTKTAKARGDVPALAYQRAIEAWLSQAAEAVAEIRQGGSAEGRHGAPNTFFRAAAASKMMRTTLEPATA
jgi:hypothetical protein